MLNASFSDYLDISRPSQGETQAWVHHGMSAPPNIGSGMTHLWTNDANGAWAATEEVVSRWLA